MMTDVVGDFFTRIRNAQLAGRESVEAPHSKLKQGIAEVLKREGFVRDVQSVDMGAGKGKLVLKLKYDETGEALIDHIGRVSRPGHRVYSGHQSGRKVRSGLGITILTTPLGIMTDREAAEKKVGGEVLGEIW